MGWFSKKRREPVEAPVSAPDFLPRASAQEILEERENAHLEALRAADAAVEEAQTWLDEHPKTHSARRGDVRRLIEAVKTLQEYA